ncbi:hypothetical protein ABZ845_10580 [Streptomyces sp. NPDC047022]|uniref:hypothetical protein n=1 Tax=Streptomyces sp. NPDC047022 TaxID=3155737 RepID=UPI0033DD5B85
MAVVLILLVFLLTTSVLAYFGVGDLTGALTFPGRITGAVLIVVSFATLLGAAAVVDHWFWNSFVYSGVVALIGASAAFLTNVMLLVEICDSGDKLRFKVAFGLLAVGSAWAVFAVWRTSVEIPAPKRVAAAVIVTSVIAVANFGYQSLYQPSLRDTQPLIKLTMEEPVLRQDHKAFAVPVDVRLENHSDVAFYVLGSEIHTMGERVPLSTKDRLRQQWRADAEQWNKSVEKNPLSRREIHESGELVTAQPVMPYGVWIDANDAFATRVVVQMPIDTPYDQVAFYASASFARKDRLGLTLFNLEGYSWAGGKVPKWETRNNDDAVVYRGRVSENNAIDALTRDPRYVTVYWNFGTHGASVASVIARYGEEGTQPESVSRYGIVDVEMGPIDRILWDIKTPR